MSAEFSLQLLAKQHHQDLIDEAQKRRDAKPPEPTPTQPRNKHQLWFRPDHAKRPVAKVDLTARYQPQLSTIDARYHK